MKSGSFCSNFRHLMFLKIERKSSDYRQVWTSYTYSDFRNLLLKTDFSQPVTIFYVAQKKWFVNFFQSGNESFKLLRKLFLKWNITTKCKIVLKWNLQSKEINLSDVVGVERDQLGLNLVEQGFDLGLASLILRLVRIRLQRIEIRLAGPWNT